MKNKIRIRKVLTLIGIVLFVSDVAFAEELISGYIQETETNNASVSSVDENIPSETSSSRVDSLSLSRGLVHRFGIDFRPEYIIPTNPFLEGENYFWKPIDQSLSLHLKYSFQFQPDTYADRIYGGAYQGIGLAGYTFGDPEELGDPIAIYLFQGARISRFNRRFSLNYEWNFGISSGWKPYDQIYNSYNIMVGSKINAYINANFYLNWMFSKEFDLNTGITLTHFSNGNTKFPNAGLNNTGLKIGLIYHFNRKNNCLSKPSYQPPIPQFTRHISYDLVLFGSWRRKGVAFGDKQVPSPNAYTVLGFNFAPMYNFGYKLRVGMSLDGVYDGSANVYTIDYISGTPQEFFTPSLNKQLSLGLSGRTEYVMPYFTVGLGIGANILHGGGDLNGCYQVLALKVEVTRSSFIHVGYCLQDFHSPNFLMLGLGFRFNNKYPTFHR
ncbi:MAG: acyloxyacyl hydrolase [Dysgonamonadaceae bacterium]|jgi:hypothetical protein|nr:acyloxyacyl hydrolase [Dysgonamonadaceae bacterium]